MKDIKLKIIMTVSFALFLTLAYYPYSDDTGAKKALIEKGFKEIKIGDTIWNTNWGSKQIFATTFTAMTPKGETINGTFVSHYFWKVEIYINEIK
jgi:hypothetical protein